MSTTIAANIQHWRQIVASGEATQEQMRDAIAAIRVERLGANAISEASRERKSTAKAKAAPINSDDLLSELGI
jgi:hypothetical protein